MVVATVALSWSDPMFWGPRPPDAGYVHRVAVSSAFTALGLGSRILDWAAGRVVDQGRSWLRLDCAADNTSLRAYYEARGFRCVDEIDIHLPSQVSPRDPWPAALYQKPA
jgi:protein-tyrosine phosphatase